MKIENHKHAVKPSPISLSYTYKHAVKNKSYLTLLYLFLWYCRLTNDELLYCTRN